MNLYKNHYYKTVTKDLVSRFSYKNAFQIAGLEKLTINSGVKNFVLKESLPNFLLLELITSNYPKLTKSKKTIPFLNIKKNFPNGAKINLKKNEAYNFFQKLGLYIFPNFRKNKNYININKSSSFSFSLKEIDNFQEVTFFYKYFKQIKEIDINIKLKSFINNKVELLFFLSSFKFPVFLRK